VREKVRLKRIGDSGLNFLDSFVGACSGASAVEGREWCDVDFSFDLCVCVVTLTFAVAGKIGLSV
jgi:hypothetical protein